MKKLNILMIIMLVMSSCQMFLLDSSEWTGPTRRKGQSDYGIRIAEDTILENPKTIKKIGGYSIPMPENIIFKYGSSAYGLDVIFGKKRKYLYNTQTGNGTQVYLIEETMESLKNEVYGKKGDRYRVRYGARGGVLIGIKPNIFILCSTLDSDPHTGYPDCEAIVKVMKGEQKLELITESRKDAIVEKWINGATLIERAEIIRFRDNVHYDEYLKNESAQWREVYRPLSLMAGYTPSYIRYINERMFEEARRDMESLMKGDNKK